MDNEGVLIQGSMWYRGLTNKTSNNFLGVTITCWDVEKQCRTKA